MNPFKVHTIESALELSKPMLESSVSAFGMNPILDAVMDESPELLEAYKIIHEIFSIKPAFDADELTVVWQTINIES